MPQITCKHCGTAFVTATISGTMFCPHCKKAFWLTEKDGPAAPAPSARAVPPQVSMRAKRNSQTAWILVAGAGLLMFAVAGFLAVRRSSLPVAEKPAASAESLALDPEWQNLQLEMAKERGRLQEIEVQLAVEQRKNETLQWQIDSQSRLQSLPVAAPKPVHVEAPPKPAPGADFTRLVNNASRSVVVVLAGEGGGTGFIVSKDGVVVTNHHVVQSYKKAHIELQTNDKNKTRLKDVTVIMADDDVDLALIQLPPAPEDVAVDGGYPFLPVREAETKIADEVFAIGNPGVVLDFTVTRGIVSDPKKFFAGSCLIQTTAVANQGNSGGPLLDMQGRVVGVITLKNMMQQMSAYCIPAAEVRRLLERYQVKFKSK